VFESPPFWMYAVGFLLLLGPLITVHELGHYLVGRWFGVKADTFSVGFGKELVGYTDRRGTRWKLSALPLGGYVQFAGDMSPTSQPDAAWRALPEEERKHTFPAQAMWKRSLIVLAGPVTNLLVALAIFTAFFVFIGRPVLVDPADSTLVHRFAKESVAEQAGIEIGDRIVAIDGERVAEFDDLTGKVVMYPGKDVVLTVERTGRRLDFPLTLADVVERDRFGNSSRVGRLGVYSAPFDYEPVGIGSAMVLSGEHSVALVRMMVTGIGQIITGERSVRELGGPVKIAKFSGEQLSLGPIAFVNFVALISINLAFINLLPIPALDGGHLAFYAAEAVRRKPLGPRSQEWAFRTGIALVLALMLFVTINDIASLPWFGG